jgi:gluconokinase
VASAPFSDGNTRSPDRATSVYRVRCTVYLAFMILILFGVSGAGKTVVGRQVAKRLDWGFLDADDYHPVENVEKMRGGIALDDSDRAPWLEAMNAELRLYAGRGENVVLACSVLKRAYRDTLAAGVPTARFVYLKVHREELLRRLRERKGHFMKATLLDSQLSTLEEPEEDENAWVIESEAGVEETAEEIVAIAQARAG